MIAGTPRIKSGDGVFCFNFRADRMRQIVRALALDGFDGFDVKDRPAIKLVTLTQYDATFPFPVAFCLWSCRASWPKSWPSEARRCFAPPKRRSTRT